MEDLMADVLADPQVKRLLLLIRIAALALAVIALIALSEEAKAVIMFIAVHWVLSRLLAPPEREEEEEGLTILGR